MAGGPGFEPGLTESESAVLPLNYPPTAWHATADDRAIGGGTSRPRCSLGQPSPAGLCAEPSPRAPCPRSWPAADAVPSASNTLTTSGRNRATRPPHRSHRLVSPTNSATRRFAGSSPTSRRRPACSKRPGVHDDEPSAGRRRLGPVVERPRLPSVTAAPGPTSRVVTALRERGRGTGLTVRRAAPSWQTRRRTTGWAGDPWRRGSRPPPAGRPRGEQGRGAGA